jgi:hypothetical protein
MPRHSKIAEMIANNLRHVRRNRRGRGTYPTSLSIHFPTPYQTNGTNGRDARSDPASLLRGNDSTTGILKISAGRFSTIAVLCATVSGGGGMSDFNTRAAGVGC